jgi:PIN domain nuclease of toxin-antitoxin system
VNILLDIHALIWVFDGNGNLGNTAIKKIENPKNTNFISVASFWEIAIKISIGKLEMDLSMEDLQKLAWENGLEVLPIKVEHTFQLRSLPYHHKDPFDRLLFSQALFENMDVVSCDEIFDTYMTNTSMTRIWK